MFGLSIGKLLVLVLIVLVAWYGFKRIGRWRRVKDAGGSASPGARPRPGTEDLVPCSVCGTYAPKPLAICPSGRNDCPLLENRA